MSSLNNPQRKVLDLNSGINIPLNQSWAAIADGMIYFYSDYAQTTHVINVESINISARAFGYSQPNIILGDLTPVIKGKNVYITANRGTATFFRYISV